MCCHAWLEAGKGLRRATHASAWRKCLELNLFIDFKETQFRHPQITKKSQFLQNLTSPALTPYYS